MTLENILQELGAEKPFNTSGGLTADGTEAWDRLIRIVIGLHNIGAIKETPEHVECYCNEIVRLDF